jgi:hypothetical protein
VAYNEINGLFHIPDEGSFLKKLILANEPIFNKDVSIVFKHLQANYPDIELIQEDNYFALMLPAQSAGVKLEAMFITTMKEGTKLLSIYHRVHFDPTMYEMENLLIEADAFLRMSAVVINVPLEDNLEGLAYLMNYQIQEALNIEITMLTLSDANEQIAVENILPFVMNAIGRYMLACSLDGVDYTLPQTSDDLARMVADYCDIPLVTALTGVGNLVDWKSDVEKSALAFISEFASSTSCLMFLYIPHAQIDQFLDKGFKVIKDYLLDSQKRYGLKTVVGDAETLNQFQRIDLDEIRDDIAQNLEQQKEQVEVQKKEEAFKIADFLKPQ